MENLFEVRIRVSGVIFSELKHALKGVLSEIDTWVASKLPNNDVELEFSVPNSSENMELLEDALYAYRLVLRYVAKLHEMEMKAITPKINKSVKLGAF